MTIVMHGYDFRLLVNSLTIGYSAISGYTIFTAMMGTLIRWILPFFALSAMVLAYVPIVNSAATEQNKKTPRKENVVGTGEITLETPTGKLYGTLELPHGAPTYPVALIIPGSGPTDRDGNSTLLSGKNNSLKLLAFGLAYNRIASLRIDKRGIGASLGAATKEEDLRFDTYVDDAVAWIELLKKDPRFSNVIVIGHSEGSLVGMLAAQKAPVSRFISIAGAGTSADILLRSQIQELPTELRSESESIITELKAGRTVTKSNPALAALFRPSVQPYLISWFRYDPAKEIGKLNLPVLVLQGTTDIQVSAKDATLLSNARKDTKPIFISGMNHVLKTAPRDRNENIKTYSNPQLPLAPGLLQPLVKFIKTSS